jgi:hypothetical protein
MKREKNVMDEVNRIVASDLADLDKVLEAFGAITSSYIEGAEREIDLARAMGDQESLVRRQIKMETIKHARHILNDCTMLVTRRRGLDE